MKRWLGIVAIVGIAWVVCLGLPLKTSAQTTAEYYEAIGKFDVEKKVIHAGDWTTFINAYRDEQVTKISFLKTSGFGGDMPIYGGIAHPHLPQTYYLIAKNNFIDLS